MSSNMCEPVICCRRLASNSAALLGSEPSGLGGLEAMGGDGTLNALCRGCAGNPEGKRQCKRQVDRNPISQYVAESEATVGVMCYVGAGSFN